MMTRDEWLRTEGDRAHGRKMAKVLLVCKGTPVKLTDMAEMICDAENRFESYDFVVRQLRHMARRGDIRVVGVGGSGVGKSSASLLDSNDLVYVRKVCLLRDLGMSHHKWAKTVEVAWPEMMTVARLFFPKSRLIGLSDPLKSEAA